MRLLRRAALALAATWLVAAAPPAQQPFDRMVAGVKADMLADPGKAINSAQAALVHAGQEPDAERRAWMTATAGWLLGEAYGRTGQSARALPILARARKVAQRKPESLLLADILLSEGAALTDTGQVTKALTDLQRAHALFLKRGEARSRAKALILIALLYNRGRDNHTALRYFAQARDAYDDDPGLLLAIHNGRGITLNELGRYAEAEREFQRSLPIARSMGSELVVAQLYGNIADAQRRQGHLARAEATVARGLELVKSPAAGAVRPSLLAVAAAVAFRQGDVARADALITDRFRDVDLDTTVLDARDGHETAYQVAAARGEPARALAHLAALKRLDDQATEIARSTGAALAAARFDYTNQELRIAKLQARDLQKSVAFERATARTQRLFFIAIAAATLLVIALLATGIVTLRRSRNKVRAAYAELATTNVALEQALAAKTAFLATTSHEIRTPLNGILGMTQVMIADRRLDPATRDRLSVVHGAGVTMRALVDDILDMAKIETGKMTIELAPLDLHETLDEAARLWRDQAAEKRLAFAVERDNCPQWVVGDAARLRQIIFNLLSNAVKFTAAGHVILRASGEGDRLRIMVEDTGIGIAAAAQDVIFESFRQADTSTTRQFGGTGLGLSICRNLARAMGGDVTVASVPGKGTVFTVDLPLVAAEAAFKAPTRPALLMVERSPITRAMFKTLFAPLGDIAFAGDCDEAVGGLSDLQPERVLVDAGSLGDEAPADALRAIVAAAGGVPVSLLCPAADDQMRAHWQATGVVQVIERPVSKAVLLARVADSVSALVPEAA